MWLLASAQAREPRMKAANFPLILGSSSRGSEAEWISFPFRARRSSWDLQVDLTQLLSASPLDDLKLPLVVTWTLRSRVGKLGDNVIISVSGLGGAST